MISTGGKSYGARGWQRQFIGPAFDNSSNKLHGKELPTVGFSSPTL